MKKLTFLTALLLTGLSYQAKSQDYIEQMTQSVCECYDSIPADLVGQEFNMQLGFCILEAAQPHWDAIEADLGVTMSNFSVRGEELGYRIGVRMASQCPKVAMALAPRSQGEQPGDYEFEANVLSGVVTKVDGQLFAEIKVRDEEDKMRTFYILTTVETNVLMEEDLSDLIGKMVYITYREEELFDYRIKEYRNFMIIESLTVE